MSSAETAVYRTAPVDGFEWVRPVDAVHFETFHAVKARSAGGEWVPVEMGLIRTDDQGRPQRRADLPWLGSDVLVLRDEAIEAVGPLLLQSGELLPLACDEADLVVFSARLVEGALDEERSRIVRFPSGKILALPRPVFHDDVVSSARAFGLAEMPRGPIFLTQPLADAIRATGLSSGTDFGAVAP